MGKSVSGLGSDRGQKLVVWGVRPGTGSFITEKEHDPVDVNIMIIAQF